MISFITKWFRLFHEHHCKAPCKKVDGFGYLAIGQESKLTFQQLARRANDIKCLLAREDFNLPEKKRYRTISFEVNFGKTFVKCTSWQKALNLQNKRSRVSNFENQVFACIVMSDVNVT